MKDLIYNPIIPIWLMAIICILILITMRKGVVSKLRLVLMVIILFIINLRPMIPGEPVQIQKQEINSYVLFVVDDTLSMLARDGRDGGTRMEDVWADTEHIINSLPGAHFGALAYHNNVIQLSPYTDNGAHVINSIDSLYPPGPIYAHGSNMSVVKDSIVNNLTEISKKKGIKLYVIFISDGEITNEETLDSFAEIKPLIDGGAVLGYGTEKGADMMYKAWYEEEESPVTYWSSETFEQETAISVMDEKNLKSIASDMGVKYQHMDSADSADSIINKIYSEAELVMTSQGIDTIDTATDTYFYWVIPFMLLLIWEAVEIIRKK